MFRAWEWATWSQTYGGAECVINTVPGICVPWRNILFPPVLGGGWVENELTSRFGPESSNRVRWVHVESDSSTRVVPYYWSMGILGNEIQEFYGSRRRCDLQQRVSLCLVRHGPWPFDSDMA